MTDKRLKEIRGLTRAGYWEVARLVTACRDEGIPVPPTVHALMLQLVGNSKDLLAHADRLQERVDSLTKESCAGCGNTDVYWCPKCSEEK